MIKKFYFVIIIVFIFSLFSFQATFATSGACSWHRGVNCSAGAGVFGQVICNDGWTESSVSYYATKECSLNNQVFSLPQSSCIPPVSSCSQNQLNHLDYEMAQACIFNSSCNGSTVYQDLQNQYADCKVKIDAYNIQLRTYNQCLSNETINKQNQIQQYYQNQQQNQQQYYQQQQDILKKQQEKYQQEQQNILNLLKTYINESCKTEFGIGAIPGSVDGTCVCSSRYTWNLQRTQCVNSNDNNSLLPPAIPSSTQSQTNITPISTPIITTSTDNSVSVSNKFSINKNLKLGDSGNDIIQLQKFLENKGFLILPQTVTEGYFGGLTKRALIAFQQSVGLPATGYCGTLTRRVINKE